MGGLGEEIWRRIAPYVPPVEVIIPGFLEILAVNLSSEDIWRRIAPHVPPVEVCECG